MVDTPHAPPGSYWSPGETAGRAGRWVYRVLLAGEWTWIRILKWSLGLVVALLWLSGRRRNLARRLSAGYEMVARARERFPDLDVRLADAERASGGGRGQGRGIRRARGI